ncbi:MAG: hypothetical protein QOJ64_2166 [Acidobacteriota bacterium]|jgi:hypothetical protein|nr:hypothetical protein [Acidobacteriota bacterium]
MSIISRNLVESNFFSMILICESLNTTLADGVANTSLSIIDAEKLESRPII